MNKTIIFGVYCVAISFALAFFFQACSPKSTVNEMVDNSESVKANFFVKLPDRSEKIALEIFVNKYGTVTLDVIVDSVSRQFPDIKYDLIDLSPEMVGIDGPSGSVVSIDPLRDNTKRISVRAMENGLIRFYQGKLEASGTIIPSIQ